MNVIYSGCPVCKGVDISKALSATDFTVSHEAFEIWHCNNCTVRFTQSVPDKEEIIKYYQSENYISHSDTKTGFINSLYHSVRRRTLISKKDLIKRYTKTGRGKVLDVGAGTGAFLNIMKEAAWQVTGLEPDVMAREKAKELYGISLQSSEELFNLSPETFDAVTLWHVLEHVHDLHEYMHQLKVLLKPGGCLFIAVPNYTSYDAKVYQQNWAAYDVPRHLYHFSPKSMTQLLLQHGLQLEDIKPMWYDSFYVSLLSEKYKKGKNDIIPAFWNGLVSNCKAIIDNERCSSLIYIIQR